MDYLRHLPIKRKLMGITMLASVLALLIACVAFFTYEQITSRQRLVQGLVSTARMAGLNSAAGLAFNDSSSVEQTLKSLSVQPNIVFACVYGRDGRPFATYQRAGQSGVFSPPPLSGPGYHFGPNRLELYERIELDGETIGTVYLSLDLGEMTARLWRYLTIVGAVLAASSLAAFLLSVRLQKVISQPLTDLAGTVTLVAVEQNYSLRAVKQGNDEIGRLIDGFNNMLAQIQERDNALQTARDTLEERVQERTNELVYERDLLKTLLDNLPDSIYFKDLQSRFVRLSRSKLRRAYERALACQRDVAGADPEAKHVPPHLASVEEFGRFIEGKSDFDFMSEESARSTYEIEQEIIRTGQPVIGRIEQNTRQDGKIEWVLSTKMAWRDQEGKIIGTFGSSKDITAMKEAEAKLVEVHRQLMDSSRQAGMAEVATSVLHNVGNVLNSVNTSAGVIADLTRGSSHTGVAKMATLFEQHKQDLAGFLTRDSRADQVLAYLKALAERLAAEHARVLKELRELTGNIEHVKEIVAMQQSYAKVCGVIEMHSVQGLVEDALRLHAAGLARHAVRVVREFEPLPAVALDKHKVLQILVNLISNAKYALSGSPATERRLTLGVHRLPDNRIQVRVADNGIGIAAENLTRIFSHGFTTRRDGHGFGLHSGALAAREMGGALQVQSDGLGKGATFILELPSLTERPQEST